MKAKIKTRKISKLPFTTVTISIEKQDCEIAKNSTKFVTKSFIVKSLDKRVINGEVKKYLRNVSQKALFVELT